MTIWTSLKNMTSNSYTIKRGTFPYGSEQHLPDNNFQQFPHAPLTASQPYGPSPVSKHHIKIGTTIHEEVWTS